MADSGERDGSIFTRGKSGTKGSAASVCFWSGSVDCVAIAGSLASFDVKFVFPCSEALESPPAEGVAPEMVESESDRNIESSMRWLTLEKEMGRSSLVESQERRAVLHLFVFGLVALTV